MSRQARHNLWNSCYVYVSETDWTEKEWLCISVCLNNGFNFQKNTNTEGVKEIIELCSKAHVKVVVLPKHLLNQLAENRPHQVLIWATSHHANLKNVDGPWPFRHCCIPYMTLPKESRVVLYLQ